MERIATGCYENHKTCTTERRKSAIRDVGCIENARLRWLGLLISENVEVGGIAPGTVRVIGDVVDGGGVVLAAARVYHGTTDAENDRVMGDVEPGPARTCTHVPSPPLTSVHSSFTPDSLNDSVSTDADPPSSNVSV